MLPLNQSIIARATQLIGPEPRGQLVDYIEDFKTSLELSTSTVNFLKDKNQPPHPRNFTLLYTYYLNKLPALRAEVDQVLASGQELSPELLTGL